MILNNLFEPAITEIKSNKSIRESGKLICIPWDGLPKFSQIIPGVEKKRYTICTANSKVGKTQITDFMFMYEPLNFILNNPDCGLDIKILYFSLEISKKAKIHSIISNRLFTKHKIKIPPDELLSKYKDSVLNDEIIQLIENDVEYMNYVQTKLEIIDHIRNPYGIYKYCRNYFHSNGVVEYDEIETDIGTIKSVKNYIPNNPNLITIILIDNYNNLQSEKGGDLHSAIHKFSSDYAITLRDKYEACIAAVQQQAAAKENQQFTNKGNLIDVALRPSPDGLGDCKLSGRDVDYMFGLFAPHRYQIPNWSGYDLTTMKDNYRELSLSLNRHGSGFVTDHLYFDGKVNFFRELPDPLKEKNKMDMIYNKIIKNEL